MTAPRPESGFTLMEILVALTVFAVAASMAVGMLAVTVDAEAANAVALDRVESLERARTLLRDDMGQIVNRPVRDDDGATRNFVFVGAENGIGDRSARGADETVLMSFTRRGWANPGLLQPRSSLMRVDYVLQGDTIYRRVSAYPDRDAGTPQQDHLLLSGVSDVELEFLQGNSWSRRVLAPAFGGEGMIPRAIRLRYTLPEFGELEHLVMTGVAE